MTQFSEWPHQKGWIKRKKNCFYVFCSLSSSLFVLIYFFLNTISVKNWVFSIALGSVGKLWENNSNLELRGFVLNCISVELKVRFCQLVTVWHSLKLCERKCHFIINGFSSLVLYNFFCSQGDTLTYGKKSLNCSYSRHWEKFFVLKRDGETLAVVRW